MNIEAQEEAFFPACKLSVCMIAFNHEKYIEKAIRSVFSQVADFDIELVIFDDASSDGTSEVIRSITPPPNVSMIVEVRDRNVGMLRNFVSAIERCKGKYIALLEGDDYWIDSSKLQRQVNFLDENPEFSICFHPVRIDSGAEKLTLETGQTEREISDIFDLARGNFMHTCSVVFRARLFEKFPDDFYKSTVGDYFLHMLNAQYGKIKRLPEVMGAYRVHEGGVWSMQPNMDLKILTYLEAMVGCFDPEISDILKNRHQSIAVKSFFNRLAEPGFEDRLKRATLFGSEGLQNALVKSGAGKARGSLAYYIKRVKSYF